MGPDEPREGMPLEERPIPRRIPVFPLPNVIFFPNTSLPLHIFEARYRKMVSDCLKATVTWG